MFDPAGCAVMPDVIRLYSAIGKMDTKGFTHTYLEDEHFAQVRLGT